MADNLDDCPIPRSHDESELTELQRRISRALSQPQFRLTFRIAADLKLDEALVDAVLRAVPRLMPRLDLEKRLEEERVRAEYQGEITKIAARRSGSVRGSRTSRESSGIPADAELTEL